MKRNCILIENNLMVFLCFIIGWSSLGSSAIAETADDGGIPQVLSRLQLAGGISGGWFFAENPGEDASGSEFLLSNLLVELSYEDEVLPMGFVAAFGETSTPSVLDAPENNKTLAFEYAGISLTPAESWILEVGLLGPNSGFENTYTFANNNILLGAVASQQPYNAYGVKFEYETGRLAFWGGYYKDRLDGEEYNSPADAWEIGVNGELAGNDIGFYHYHVGGFRHLTGLAIERTIEGMDVGVNIDYWTWSDRMQGFYGSDGAIGGAIYVCQRFGNFSIPLRFEYIQQNESEIYIESPDTDDIFTAVITPTYHFYENAYTRAEVSYVATTGGFISENGDTEDRNVGLAVEFGITF